MSDSGMGARVKRKEDERHLHVRDRFVSDILLPNLHELAFLRSPLAQFTRSGIVVDFVERLTGEFASNLGAAMVGEEVVRVSEPLQMGGMFFAVIRARIRRLFGV